MDIIKGIIVLGFGLTILGTSSAQQPIKDRERGALIGRLKQFEHEVSGVVWALDEDTLYIENFTYDGLGPDAFFWMGTESQPSPTGFMVDFGAEPSNKEMVLPRIQGDNLILHLPPGKKILDQHYLSVWCRRFTVDFGHVIIPPNLPLPRKRILPEFTRAAHGVRSGNVTILDAKTFYIPDLHYDGAGPDAFFWVGSGYIPDIHGSKVPNEVGSSDVLRGYQGEDIEIQLPGNLTVYEIDYLSIWCVEYRHDFGHVRIPPASELWVPPALGQTKLRSDDKPYKEDPKDVYATEEKPHTMGSPDLANCHQLNDDLQVEWESSEGELKVKLSGRIEQNEYMAFGISSDQNRAQMINSDVVVTYQDDNDGSYHAADYFMTSKAQCDGHNGVCPDERLNGRNDAAVIGGERLDGITSVTFSRSLVTSDTNDVNIRDNGQPTTVIAAVGRLNGDKQANYHHKFVTKDLIRINLFGKGANTCSQLVPEKAPAPKIEPWPINFIRDTVNISAMIGPTGGQKGYSAITGTPSWGIAWWLNEKLIPELFVERGQTYYFTIEGGDDPTNSARHHPFYITSDKEGGFGQKTADEQRQEKIFEGVKYSKAEIPEPKSEGRLCEWKHESVDSWADSVTFKDYRNTLYRDCQSGKSGSLVWTVAEDTPDLVYYQCYTHRNMGWKIHVHDPGFNLPRAAGSLPLPSLLLLMVGVALHALR